VSEPEATNVEPAVVGNAIPETIELAITSGSNPKAGVGAGRKYQITRRGIVFEGKLTFEQWKAGLAGWLRAKDLFHVGYADWLIYGKDNFGEEKVDETLELFGADMADAIKAYAIGQIPLDLRLDNLTGEHYWVLAKELPSAKKEQGKWAALAEKHGLTPAELKQSIQAGKIVRQEAISRERGSNSGIPNIEGVTLIFQRVVKQIGGESKILEQPLEWKLRFLDEVHPIVEIAHKVEETIPENILHPPPAPPAPPEPSEQEKIEANEMRSGPEKFHAPEAPQAAPTAEVGA
jgi:hypothetical protein